MIPRALILLLLAAPGLASAATEIAPRTWEVGGIRLEEGQLERLADELAERTLEAVEENVEGIALREEQKARMQEIYATVALDVFDRVVAVFEDEALDDATRQARARELVLEGQRRSSAALEEVLDPEQLALYREWEAVQVEAFQSRRFESQRHRRRR